MRDELKKALTRHGWVIIRQFNRLSDIDKREVERLFRRHSSACLALGIETDPHFLPEAISEQKKFGNDVISDLENEYEKEAAATFGNTDQRDPRERELQKNF